jgi:succinyl-CoA synthetase beta subunit
MDLYEYQAKSLLKGFEIPLLRGKVAYTVQEAVEVAKIIRMLAEPASNNQMSGSRSVEVRVRRKYIEKSLWVVKAQIHAGGRGKAGGIILARSLKEIELAAEKLFHQYLITPQTDSKGEEVTCLYIEQGCSIEKEFYISLSLDRQQGRIALVVSKAGGVDIEKVAHTNPEDIVKILIDPYLGVQPFQLSLLEKCLQLSDRVKEQFSQFVLNLYRAYNELDAILIEINPFVLTADQKLYALDAKVSIDDNALYKHPQLKELEKSSFKTPIEQIAHQHELSYVKLDGSIGCMVNGAGLAMATMDLIQFHGGNPANFLDVGGGADQERVKIAFQLILSDPQVKAIFINIFGGIMRCDVIAEGIIAAAKETNLTLPIVARLQGTNHQEASQILSQSDLKIIAIENLDKAAQKVVHAANEAIK